MKGVYQIRNKQNRKRYIGSSQNIKKRWRDHKRALYGNYHDNQHLQRSWKKNGEKAFVFELLEETSDITKREQWYLDNVIEWRRDYNMARDATNAMKGRHHSKETKRKIGEANRGKVRSEETLNKLSKVQSGKNNPNWGKTTSKETKRKIRKALTGRKYTEERRRKTMGEKGGKSKLTEEQAWEIHVLYDTENYTYKQLAKMFPVSYQQIGRIINGVDWEYTYKKFHEEATT